MKKFLSAYVLLLLAFIPAAFAQDDEEVVKITPDMELLSYVASNPQLTIDTTFVKKHKQINNYSMLGVQYGVNFASAMMNPTREFAMQLMPVEVGIVYTHYSKMFGYMPYFGFQGGLFYSQQAYSFSVDKDSGYPSSSLLGAYKVKMNVIELPVWAQMHVDFWKLKAMINIGVYAGYRLDINRTYHDGQCGPADVRRQYQNSFHKNENRFFYGVMGGGGLALMLDPIEIHLTAAYKYGLSYVHQPNISTYSFETGADKSNYYYTWTNLSNIVVSVGVHYQISRRIGSSRKTLRQEAKRQAREILGEDMEENQKLGENLGEKDLVLPVKDQDETVDTTVLPMYGVGDKLKKEAKERKNGIRSRKNR